MTDVFTLNLLGGGLVLPASPGSILAVLAMTPFGEGDRLIKPLRWTLEYGLGHANLVKGKA